MSDCCQSTSPSPEVAVVGCPGCGERGISVELTSVKAQLREQALARSACASHRFCRTATCDVVYYDEFGSTYRRADVRVPIWQKEPAGDRVICYCFGENERSIADEIARRGSSHAVARVRDHVQAGRCACETRNPRGACCLGDLTAIVQEFQHKSRPVVGVK